MTCEHCSGAEQFFDKKEALKQLKKYNKRGPTGSTAALIRLIESSYPNGSSLLDIGGGVGAIQWSFLDNTSGTTTGVDASGAYLEIAQQKASENGIQDRVRFIKGDFNDVTEEVGKHDFVTLDKVICCYPDYKLLLSNSAEKCIDKLCLTFPMGGPISRFLSYLSSFYFRIKNSAFRTYIHEPTAVHSFIVSQGFKLSAKDTKFPWLIRVYERN